ncbi:hypothetical protein WA1_44525 [Scytonema hofmannii PCC 7110]|uniref:Uncharacterized protein n=1 Tax=Scytonema hofmannii PCC 7110 TaxID=128403 RepID=A0A139WWD0_9CYAN|nr:hypothetical protein [Scytonema hofmannii]KYC36746.1 hypothetical protein WA1_44525 [Scytonema hofmannii PCC 7110]
MLETPIHSRLKAFLEAPISIFWCWSEATRRYALQLGLVENHREEGLKDYIVEDRLKRQKEIVRDCLWRAMLAIASYPSERTKSCKTKKNRLDRLVRTDVKMAIGEEMPLFHTLYEGKLV